MNNRPLQFNAPIPLSLYVHIPWCVRKCPYCDFNSHKADDLLPEQAYIEALLYDLEQDLPQVWGRSVSSIFIGGGTPSLFSPESLDQLLRGIRARLPLTSRAEITMEANPGTAEQGKFNEFRAAGINRLSLGIQSFDTGFLEKLGRVHSGAEALKAVAVADRAGFDNVNLDLMFGLPGQTPEQAMEDLATAIQLAPEHISYYQLTLEPNTWFYRHPPNLPPDDDQWRMQQAGTEALASADYERYEVSAYAQAGRRCEHNLNYWEFGDYLGIGAGAHAKLTLPATQSVMRKAKQRSPTRYLELATARVAMGTTKIVPKGDIAFEFFLNGLRKVNGVSTEQFLQRTGLGFSEIERKIDDLKNRALLVEHPDHIQCTERGFQFLNEVITTFLPAQS